MPTAFLRFYAELNDFLPADRRYVESPYSLDEPIRGNSPTNRGPHAGSPRGVVEREGVAHLTDFTNQVFEDTKVSVEEIIESLGVPPTEVDLILANGESVDFSHIVRDGERISIYPVFEALNITPLVRLRPHPLRQLRFVLDNHLGKLATFLRILGFDALYRNNYNNDALVQISVGERRILLTRDRGLLGRKEITHGYRVLSTNPEKQLIEVVQRFDLSRAARPFTRCLRCNDLLQSITKEAVGERLPPKTREAYDDFHICLSCQRLYWEGPHYQRMKELVKRILGQ
jgi:uncharacterized protein